MRRIAARQPMGRQPTSSFGPRILNSGPSVRYPHHHAYSCSWVGPCLTIRRSQFRSTRHKPADESLGLRIGCGRQDARASASDMTLSSSVSGKSKSIGNCRDVAISTISSSMDSTGSPVLTLCRIIKASLWTGTGVDCGRSSKYLLISIITSASMLLGGLRIGLLPALIMRSAESMSLAEISERS